MAKKQDSLGTDFWKYRIGQVVSTIGDSCFTIALAWWVLDKTGSASEMGKILAPPMLIRIFLMPLFGPLADRFDRKKLVALSDLWRFVFSSIISVMVYFDHYNPSLLVINYILLSVGSALFNASSGGLIPQIVKNEFLSKATQQSQVINSTGMILGGVLGGVVVSSLGVFGAFVIDSASYLVAFVFTILIRADTRIKIERAAPSSNPLRVWASELIDGFKILKKVPLLFWICFIAMFLNFTLSPLAVILPVLAKEARNMPAWFLGGLESSISLGLVFGSLIYPAMTTRLKTDHLIVMSIMMIGFGTLILNWIPNEFLPMSVMFWIGIGCAWANIPMNTQFQLALPNHYRGRIGATMGFMCQGISPIGVAAVGILIGGVGLTWTLAAMGGIVLCLTPLMLWIPKFKEFMRATPEEATRFLEVHYPGAIDAIPTSPGVSKSPKPSRS